jgi:hypothetical protein
MGLSKFHSRESPSLGWGSLWDEARNDKRRKDADEHLDYLLRVADAAKSSRVECMIITFGMQAACTCVKAA